MNSLGRILLLAAFASGGVGLAVCLAVSSEVTESQSTQSPDRIDIPRDAVAPTVTAVAPKVTDTASRLTTPKSVNAISESSSSASDSTSTKPPELSSATKPQPPTIAPPPTDITSGQAPTSQRSAAAAVPPPAPNYYPRAMPPLTARTGDRYPERVHPLRTAPTITQIAHPFYATPHPPVRDQVEARNEEPSLPISTMLQLFDKVLQRDDDKDEFTPAPPVLQQPPVPLPRQPAQPPTADPPVAQPPTRRRIVSQANDRLTLNLRETDIREVLDLLSQGSGRNIMATKSVEGTVTATLQDVSFDTALNAILKSTGYVAHQDGNIIYVGTADEFRTEAGPVERVATRIYRPNYLRAADLQSLILPLLTPEVGTISVTAPADTGIPADSASAGGDAYADAEVVLVRDYESVLKQIDQVFEDVDVRPLQVAIEAMILSVKLDDSNRLGVNFELLKDRDDTRIVSGSPLGSLAALNVTDGGLKVGFLNSNVSVFVDALETIGETDVIATPRLLVLNKQRAEILIGAELGYVSSTVTETATTQTVEFLEVGTQLRLRPFISSDGLVRMEIHPELSTGSVRVEGGFTLPDKEVTGVTTNIMARDGNTVIIGGLIREDLATTGSQIPLFGSLPGVGPLFRQQVEKIGRSEILVLITPHIIYEPEAATEGDHAAMEFHHRHAVEFEDMSPLGKRHIAHSYLIKAQKAWAQGDARHAIKYANLAIHYDPLNRAAIDFRADVWAGKRLGDHTAGAPFVAPSPSNHPLDGPAVDPWLLNQLAPSANNGHALHPLDRGQPGPRVDIRIPEKK